MPVTVVEKGGGGMRYQESVEESMAYVRQVMPLMVKHSAPMNPTSFAVWYEYVSGSNPQLAEAIDTALKNKVVLNAETTELFYRRFIADLDEESANLLALDFQRIMTDVAQSAVSTGTQADIYRSSLQQFSKELSAEVEVPATLDAIDRVLTETLQMHTSIVSLTRRLEESQKEIEKLRAEVLRARQDAMVDGLTGLANRRSLDADITTWLEKSGYGIPGPCVLLIDIDHFKKVNDTYGHLFGDKVIRTIAEVLKRNVKGQDLAARYGGEEFAVLLPETPLDGARALAEAIRIAIAGCRIRRHDTEELIDSITVSLGVACFLRGESAQGFLARADKALYASKEQGRNRVTAYGMDPMPG
jgi:diguanylate cyclase